MSKHSKKKTKIAQHRLESYGNILSDNLLKNTNNDSYIADSLFYKTDEDRLVKQENAQNDIQQLKMRIL